MRRLAKQASAVALLLLCVFATAQSPSPKMLYEQHRWFDLREAIRGHAAPALYRGAVASAFDDRKKAEKYLNRAIKDAPGSKDAEDAHEILADMYVRSGRSREAVQQLDAILRIEPARQDVESIRPIFTAFSRYPDQSIGKQRRTTVHGRISEKGIVIPISINGKSVNWGLDTGFNLSIMSESEARMLGLKIDDVSARASDLNGGTVEVRTAVVPVLAIGTVLLHNVPFLIAKDSQEPWNELPPGSRALIGLPVAIALGSVEWRSDGTIETGFGLNHPTNSDGDLCFDDLAAVTRVQFEDKQLDFIFDTGDTAGSELWSRFAADFSEMVKKEGAKSTRQVNEVGGSNIRETILLPEIKLGVGGLETTLHPATIYSQPVGDRTHHGLLGTDVLSQAREVRVDFRSMSLQLLP